MARTHVQQSQISGSLSVDIKDDVLSTDLVKAGRNLVDDLNSIRTQLKQIMGADASAWTDSAAQDLSNIYAFVRSGSGGVADAAFQGAITTVASASIGGGITGSMGLHINNEAYIGGTLTVVGEASVAALTASNLTATHIPFVSDTSALTGSSDMTFSVVDGLNLFANNFMVDSSGNAVASGSLKANGGLDPEGHLYLVGSSGQISSSVDMFFVGGLLTLSGSADISGSLSVGSGLTVAGDSMEVTGSFGVDGPATVRSLSVTGSAGITISGDVAKHLYIVDEDGSIKDEDKLWFDQTKLYISGSAELSTDLEVKGGNVTLSNSVSMSSSATDTLVITAADHVEVSANLQVTGNEISGSAGGNLTLKASGEVEVAGVLQVTGNDIKSSTGDVVLQLSGKDAYFKQDVHVAGDLYVTGTMTYIETENLMVKDAFIHIATGSVGSDDKGLVLHSGAGFDDLIMGQNAHDGTFIFGHKNVESAVDSSNSIELAGIALADAWMSGIQFGLTQGDLSGSLSVSGLNMSLSAAADLNLSANGDSVGLMEHADWANVFDAGKWAAGKTIVGALDALYAAGAGGLKKDLAYSTNVTTGTLDFGPAGANIGTLSSAAPQNIDVYLNGVLLAYGSGKDVSGVTYTTIQLDADLASALEPDDVFTVVLRGAS